MSARTVPTREALRSALDVCIGHGAPLAANEQGAFRGDAFFGEALAGPPGRLHGGLHAYARVLSILRALRGPSALTQAFPLELDMRLERALPLETALTFEGTYTESAGELRAAHALLGHPQAGRARPERCSLSEATPPRPFAPSSSNARASPRAR
jgi:hypothetical protein